ncbi:hypothetical protein [Streptomyces sp. KL116D]|uniref:hypothetical protein n=1 Tax=Streptomyces sp. KL116D TaxID=3045152 RepID=UPI003557ED9C
MVLATLLVKNNTVVSAHSLIDELWGTTPPRTASTTLQVCAPRSRARRSRADAPDTGARSQLVTQPPGYVATRWRPTRLDLVLFELLRAQEAGRGVRRA